MMGPCCLVVLQLMLSDRQQIQEAFAAGLGPKRLTSQICPMEQEQF
jgi:hypothetical protein